MLSANTRSRSNAAGAPGRIRRHGQVLANLYGVTGMHRYLNLAQRFDKKVFTDPLAAHRDELKGLHANTHVPQVIAAARLYEVTADRRYWNIADYLWNEVTTERAYCTGALDDATGQTFTAPGTPHELSQREFRMNGAAWLCGSARCQKAPCGTIASCTPFRGQGVPSQQLRLLGRSSFSYPGLATPLKNPRAWRTNGPRGCACHIMLGQRSGISPNLCSRKSELVSCWP